MLRLSQPLPTHHEDLIHDVAYDFYGRRLCTCSSDHQIMVWDQDAQGGWVCTAKWKAHQGSVWRVCWSHPEFGQVLASCSFDRTVAIWEESDPGNKKGSGTWIKRTSLVDSRNSVKDIEFSPKHWGLKLATCSSDGWVRIYEAPDVMNLTHWSSMSEFEAHKGGCNCLSWNPSRFHAPMLAIGTNDPYPKLWEYNEQYRRWEGIEVRWSSVDSEAGALNDVAFSPNMGRSYHLLATASKDGYVSIWKLSSSQANGDNTTTLDTSGGAQGGNVGGVRLQCQRLLHSDDHASEVWRVEWNVTGTILASTGDDGTVRLWKSNYLDEWKCIAVVGNRQNFDDNQ
eukprot:Colp12_sorted_trinity150504_noHs@6268